MNMEHIKKELAEVKLQTKINLKRLAVWNPKDWPHAITNIPVEIIRAAPYTLGHLTILGVLAGLIMWII